jgi:hypothetical protein
MECFVSDPKGEVTYIAAMKELRDWCNAHGRPELLKVQSNKIRKMISAIPGFMDITRAPRPKGEQRKMARIRLRNPTDRKEDEEED